MLFIFQQRLKMMKMKFGSLVSKLKQRGQVVFLVCGMAMMVITVAAIASSTMEHERKHNELRSQVKELSEERATFKKQLETVLEIHGTNRQLKSERRKKRDVSREEYNAIIEASKQRSGGAVYVRWGRTTCPENRTEMVYNGIGGGSWYDHTGGATNQQCLPNNPDWGNFNDGASGAFIYGMEYQESMSGIMSLSNVGNSLMNHNAPCAVCRSSARASVLMIPAKNACFEGWHLEYHGYLMAGHYGSKSGTNYVCVDESPEADPAGYRDENGAYLYRVTAKCGSLPCPKYADNKELVCVVCSK